MKMTVLLAVLAFFAASMLPAAEGIVPRTMIKAEHYAALKDVLRPGDIVFAFAVRDPDPAERRDAPPLDGRFRKTVWNDRKFTEHLEALSAIHDEHVEKMVVLSSLEDLKANLQRLPKDVRWIAYNSEPGMTPGNELGNIEQTLGEFAKVCHDHGYKLSWVPANFAMFDSEARLRNTAPVCDAIVLQQQRDLQNNGVGTFATLAQKRTALIKSINPKCVVEVQVVVGRGSKDDLIAGLMKVKSYVNGCDLWVMQDTDTAREILKAIR